MWPRTFALLTVAMAAGSAAALGAAAPVQPAPASAAPVVPLCPGLTIVTAVSQSDGDYESIKTIQSVDGSGVRLRYSAEMKEADLFDVEPKLKKIVLERSMLAQDLQTATDYQQVFLEESADTIPGTTSVGTSAKVLRALKARGQSEFGISEAYAGLKLTADRQQRPNYYDFLQRGVLRRANAPATLSVLVNEVPVDLPVVVAQGTLIGDKVEFTFLDDPSNPLALAFRIGIGAVAPLSAESLKLCDDMARNNAGGGPPPGAERCSKPKGGDRESLRVIKLSYRCPLPTAAAPPAATNALEQQLASAQKADVYSIYFSFNSDAVREESEPTLRDIADILRRHADWRLAVNGHTDGIGSDPYNLDLSRRRAAAVVRALSSRFGIDSRRLKSDGFGRSQPKDTNDTLEGRARNRRVELVRF